MSLDTLIPENIGELTEEEITLLAQSELDGLPGGIEEKREQIDLLKGKVLIQKAQSEFSIEGFKAFFKVVYEFDVLPYMEGAMEELFASKAVVVEAYFESAKTTTLSEGFFAYFIGHHPKTSSLLTQVSDDKSEKTAAAVADLIDVNPRWKSVFPHIVPDKEKSWGVNSGYEIKLTHTDATLEEELPYPKWREMNTERKDSTFIGLGYKSRSIIGMRVTGLLVIDDIHDESNSFSDREREGTLRRLKGTILSRATKEAWRIVVGTPWVEEDTIDFIKNTGLYTHVYIPVYDTVTEEVENAIYWERINEWVLPAWPEVFDVAYLEQKWIELGEADFARFMLLDLEKVGDRVFYWQEYNHEEVSPRWPTAGGVDFASILRESQKSDPNRSYFGMAYIAELPQGGAVVTGGVRERCTPDEAEKYMRRAQNTHEGWMGAAVEQDGKGEVFVYGLQQRHPDLVFVPMPTRGRGKEKRLEREMSPWFANGVVKISTAETPFLNSLRKEMRDYPHGKFMDCLDAVYWALRMMPHVLKMGAESDKDGELPSTKRKKREPSPFNSFANWRG